MGPPEGKDYKWYISGIFPANWGINFFPGGGNSNISYFYPDPGGNHPI